MKIKQMLDAAKVKAVVSHQHRYGEHYGRCMKSSPAARWGGCNTVYGTATGWMTHMLTHLIDYASGSIPTPRRNGSWPRRPAAASWPISHPSPDYIAGFMHFSNGVRGIVECGAGAPDVPEVPELVAQMPHRRARHRRLRRGLTGGGWRAVTKTGAFERRRRDELRPRHAALHPGNGRLAGRRQESPRLQFQLRLRGL